MIYYDIIIMTYIQATTDQIRGGGYREVLNLLPVIETLVYTISKIYYTLSRFIIIKAF